MTRLVAVLLALSTMGCGGSSSRPDEFTGTIAFIADGLRVHTVDAADSAQMRIGRAWSSGPPSWSPDGATVAYSTQKSEVMLASASGAGERQLTRASCYDPVYSPDGTRLLCEYIEPNVVTVLDATDGSVLTETGDCCLEPVWSPDGRQIAYLSYGTYNPQGELIGQKGLFVMNADGTRRRLIAKSVDQRYLTRPAWSNRGTIAFLGADGGIWTVSASGTGLTELVPTDAGNMVSFAWAPDGGRLAIQLGDGDYEIFVVNADGTGLKNLTDNEKIQDTTPTWSPDGGAIAFVRESHNEFAQIFAMRADGSGETQITTDQRQSAESLAWSPVG